MGRKKTYIDVFSGCGGLSLGLYNSGKWKAQFAIENSPDAFQTLSHNLIKKKHHFDWPEWLPQHHHDINHVIKNYSEQLKALRGTIDMVAGGPPCQGFSTAGRRVENDNRNKLIDSYIKFIRLVQPKIIFFENVRGFTQKFDKNKVKGRVYSEYVTNALKRDHSSLDALGYKVHGELVDFSQFGIPQKRTRFILVGIRKDIAHQIEPNEFFNEVVSNREKFLVSKGLSLTANLEEAISDLIRTKDEPMSDSPSFKTSKYGRKKSEYQKLMRAGIKKMPDSHRFAKHTQEVEERFDDILSKAERGKTLSPELKESLGLKKRTIIPLDPNEPAPTITTLPDDYIHYSQPRIFTVREYARVQSFNDWYEIKGKYTTGGKRRVLEVPRYSQVGNAIPPLFAEQAGHCLSALI